MIREKACIPWTFVVDSKDSCLLLPAVVTCRCYSLRNFSSALHPLKLRCNRYLVGQHVYFYLWTLHWSNTILFVLLLFLKQHIKGLCSGGLFPDYKPCLKTKNGCSNKSEKTPVRGTVICPHCLCDCTPLMPLLRVMT